MRLLLLTAGLTASIASCDRPACRTDNPVLARTAPDSEPYKRELVRLLRSGGPAQFWIDRFENRNGSPRLWVHVQGPGLCAQAALLLPPGSRWRPRADTAGGGQSYGYRGAALTGLRYQIRQSAGHTELVYRSETGVLD